MKAAVARMLVSAGAIAGCLGGWLSGPAQAQESTQVFNLKSDVEWPGEVPGPTRTWTPANRENDSDMGLLHGAPFVATLRGVFNEDTPFSFEFAIFELADGRVQAYECKSFIAADRTILHQFARQMPSAQAVDQAFLPAPTTQQTTLLDSNQVSCFFTPHFDFWSGRPPGGTGLNGQLLSDPHFVPTAAQWYEKIWRHFAIEVRAPMPYRDAPEKKKINVVLSDSGYPGAVGFANSAESMGLEPCAMQYGSSVVPHEFTHVIQFYSGGFRDGKSVGAFWETHANFGAFTFEPTTLYALPVFFEQMEKGVQWYDTRYGNWPFLMQLYEKKRTRSLVFDIWLKNHRDANGSAVEDPLETLVRLGRDNGSLPNGWESLADEWSELAQRLVTWDYIHHAYYEEATRPYREKGYVQLTASRSDDFLSPANRPLRAWGIHFIHLKAIDPRLPVAVRLSGLTQEQAAAWRFGLVAVSPSGTPRYSIAGKVQGLTSDEVSLPLHEGDTLTLAVVATPQKYLSVNWGDLPPNTFPYSVRLTNAHPL